MARGFKKRHDRFVAKLDPVERGLVVGLMEQVRELVEPPDASPGQPGSGAGVGSGAGDDFDEIVAGLGGIGQGVSLSAADQLPELSGRVPPPRDPALDRIFPTANREDEQAAAEFRRLTEDSLRARKTANLDTAIAALAGLQDQRVSLDQAQALALVVALTDVRLVLGERLGLKADDDVELLEEQASALPQDDPAVYALAVYDFLTWLQETLAHALTP